MLVDSVPYLGPLVVAMPYEDEAVAVFDADVIVLEDVLVWSSMSSSRKTQNSLMVLFQKQYQGLSPMLR